jgi:uncharacterized protein YceH (UPF0502 family)
MTSAMADTTTKSRAKVASGGDKDLVARLADAGEDALQRFAELPGGQRALNAFNDLRARVDDLGKKVRGIDALEARVSKLEKQVADLKRPRASSPGRTTSRKPTS